MMSLGEMATWLPLPGAIPQFCARYVDDAMGFAVGWNVCCSPPALAGIPGANAKSSRIGIKARLLFAQKYLPLLL